jgi:hypothetical protein
MKAAGASEVLVHIYQANISFFMINNTFNVRTVYLQMVGWLMTDVQLEKIWMEVGVA